MDSSDAVVDPSIDSADRGRTGNKSSTSKNYRLAYESEI